MEKQDSKGRVSSEILDLSKAINYLGFRLYQELALEKQNLFFSPLSISSAMSMVFCAAKGSTAKELRQTLGFEDANISDENVQRCYQQFLSTLEKTPDSYTLSSANVAIIQNGFAVKKAYKKLLLECFKALSLEADFARETKKALKKVNDWVKEKTNGMITELLQKLDSDTVMVILNAVYFKGFWLNQFEPKLTKSQNFYNKGLEKMSKKVKMMNIKGKFPFCDEGTFKTIQLPYKGDEIAMLILLPKERNGLEDLESQLSSDFLLGVTKELYSQSVIVSLPKFRLEYSKSMPKNFENMGVTEIFNAGANFDGMTDSRLIVVSEIMHKAVIEVNEEGSEAAAATAVVFAIRSAPARKPPEFIVDHPFLFFIVNTKNNVVLFMGRVDEL